MRGARVRLACFTLLTVLSATSSAAAQDDFYRGKTIRIVVGYSAGGGFDTYSRAIARHLAKHVPGKPSVIVENMPGAAGLIAANSIYRAGRPDGLTIERVRTLRAAFLKTLSDPEFVSDARQAKLDVDPVSGEDVERLVGELFKMPAPVLAKLKELLR